MDEILIEEKKYVSSKRAAKMTGYAKDYIGQLCREGRVPARLVGRSWYVLETAIQDHRFGTTDETAPSASIPPIILGIPTIRSVFRRAFTLYKPATTPSPGIPKLEETQKHTYRTPGGRGLIAWQKQR